MRSTFMGLETAKRGMFTQQSALYTTGHNISNANTPGYSRQRVNFSTTEPYPAVGLNRPNIPGQMGTGVEAGSVQRIRDSFIDQQYRTENNKLGYWSARADAYTKVEDIINEPSEQGLSKSINELWDSLQTLSGSPEDNGARGVVLERIQSVTDTFNYMSNSLKAIKDDFGKQINVTEDEVNSLLKQLNAVNQQIKEIEPNGYLPNDLYDKRDFLVDELSQFLNFSIQRIDNKGNSLKNAEGTYKISLLNENGGVVGDLLNGDGYTQLAIQDNGDRITSIDFASYTKDEIPGAAAYAGSELISGANGNVNFSQGEIRGLIEAYGYEQGGATAGIYKNMLNDLDTMASALATEFNRVHALGKDLDGDNGMALFVNAGSAGTISLDPTAEEKDIAASKNGDAGDGENALDLAKVFSTTGIIGTSSVHSFYESVIGKLGVDSQQASRTENNVEVLRASVVTNRESISSVSLDEEMTNLIKFQHAYNGAARMITVVDEMLDKIINGMGVAGR
ncbi:flagellar hook-associated protein FlgK [Domibacillus epiphyticus]|uniref:Flagellar hook-associated protein 1 n=1 Tax=Domibacillus epiphyticus TaxID=1714355 RepID=A0A1V2A4R5_9BACI|nr:flagellar hook-associated protein FlgK [Domibacillus epiphyticus]OMP65804.1 flagellar hook-associated protein FlgK [Domibacillus epiphyticus]